MMVSTENFQSSSQRNPLVHVLGLCLLLGTSTLLMNLESLHSYVYGTPRRILLHDSPAAMERSVVKALRAPYKSQARKKLDFFVAGFPKCGTTTLLYAFDAHNETAIGKTEKCVILNAQVSDGVAMSRLDDALSDLNPEDSKIKRGIKCPSGIKNARSLERIQNHSPNAKLIVGVRHPVSFFQSYYNYRVTEIYDRNSSEKIPSAEKLIGRRDWKGVSTDAARFDLYLMQLGKTNMTTSQLEDFVGRPQMSVRPNNFKIFLYSIDQMRDSDHERSGKLLRELEYFLGLEKPLAPLGHENLNHFVGENAHKETINICEERYDVVRQVLVDHGRKMERWFRKEFLKSKDVIVPNEKHFLESIRSWGSDPCPKVVDLSQQRRRRMQAKG
jgi:hypothetical protein